jgi:hypothetical protein
VAFEVITVRDDVVVRRSVLQPGEATPWHTDPVRRLTVVVAGERLTIEFRDTGETLDIPVHAGLTDWDAPEPRVHRALNTGGVPFEEVVTFYLDRPGQDPQPVAG